MTTVALPQALPLNGVVAEPQGKIKVGIYLYPAVRDELAAIQGRLSKREKSTVVTAAILALARLPDETQNGLIREVMAAEGPGGDIRGLFRRKTNLAEDAVIASRKEHGDTDARASFSPQVWTGLQSRAEAAGLTLEQFLAGIAGSSIRIIVDDAGAKKKGRKRNGDRHGSGKH